MKLNSQPLDQPLVPEPYVHLTAHTALPVLSLGFYPFYFTGVKGVDISQPCSFVEHLRCSTVSLTGLLDPTLR